MKKIHEDHNGSDSNSPDLSSEDDVLQNKEWMKEDEEVNPFLLEKHSDDFYKELDVETLIHYRERNNMEMQRVINAVMNTNFFNIPNKKAKHSNYVGTKFTQNDMKNMIAIHKRLRKTFKRRLLQIMKKLNPKIQSKFIASDGMSELQLFEEQLNFLKQVQYRRIHRYEEDFNEDPRIGRALSQDISPHSIA